MIKFLYYDHSKFLQNLNIEPVGALACRKPMLNNIILIVKLLA